MGPLTSSRLFVGQLDESCTRSDLEEYFSQFGDILSMFYEQGKKNYAFVEFEDWEIAKAVLKENDHWIKVSFLHMNWFKFSETLRSQGTQQVDVKLRQFF